jgi:hypothetical protein
LTVLLLVPLALVDRFDYADSNVARVRRALWRLKFVRLLFFTLFLVYPSVSARLFSLFVCRDVPGTGASYVLADFSQKCYDDRWMRYVGVVGGGLLLYPIGIPLIFALLLWLRARAYRLDEPDTVISMGFIYEGE